MKKLYILFIAIFAMGALNAQTVTYDISLSGMGASDCPGGGCVCGITGTEEGYAGSPLTLSWTSTGAFMPTSVTLDVYEVYNDAPAGTIPVTFNASADGTYGVDPAPGKRPESYFELKFTIKTSARLNYQRQPPVIIR